MARNLRGVGAALAALLVLPAATAGTLEAAWERTPGGWRSGPIIEHVRNLPLEGGAIGAVRHGRFLYVSGPRSFSIYDIEQPDDPRLLSTRLLGEHALNEHPETNGKILLLSKDFNPLARSLEIWDVSDKADPRRIGGFPNPGADHTWTCVRDCRFAYGSHGTIVDLTDPTAPVAAGSWTEAVSPPPTRFHGIDRVAPDLVLTASEPTVLLDVSDPTSPRALATVDPPVSFAGAVNRRSLPSYAHWPLAATERFALETIETPFSGPCTEGSGGLVTFDTAGFGTTGTFEVADVYRITRNGTYTDGAPPGNVIGCSAFGLAESPDWADDRLVAVAWLEHGVRLLEVGASGGIAEVGGFMADQTEAAYPVWGTRRILYVADLARGLDVYRVREPRFG